MERAIVLLSGGLKSAVLAASQRGRYELTMLHVQTGSRASRAERAAFEQLCASWLIREPVLYDLSQFGAICGHPDFQARSSAPAPEKTSADAPDYVPGLMPAILNVALLHAQKTGIKQILVGACENAADNASPAEVRPDQSREFYQIFNELVAKIAVPPPAPVVQTPLIDLTYADIVRLGERYRVPLQKTWSCRRGREQPCDHCFGCRQRARAFLQAGIVDAAAVAGAGRNG